MTKRYMWWRFKCPKCGLERELRMVHYPGFWDDHWGGQPPETDFAESNETGNCPKCDEPMNIIEP